MRLASVDALATYQALNRNASDDLALVSCSVTLDRSLALKTQARRRLPATNSPIPATSASAPTTGEIGNVSR